LQTISMSFSTPSASRLLPEQPEQKSLHRSHNGLKAVAKWLSPAGCR
jgi:hypothetical protein